MARRNKMRWVKAFLYWPKWMSKYLLFCFLQNLNVPMGSDPSLMILPSPASIWLWNLSKRKERSPTRLQMETEFPQAIFLTHSLKMRSNLIVLITQQNKVNVLQSKFSLLGERASSDSSPCVLVSGSIFFFKAPERFVLEKAQFFFGAAFLWNTKG